MWKCIACDENNEDDGKFCWNCTSGKGGMLPQNPQAFEMAQKRKMRKPGNKSQQVPSPENTLPTIPFAVEVLPAIGGINLVISIIAALLFFAQAASAYSGGGFYFAIGIAIFIQAFVIYGLLQAVAFAVRALHSIATSLNR